MQKGPQQGWQGVLSLASCPRSLELGPTACWAGWHRAAGVHGVPGSVTAGWDPMLQLGGGGQEMGTPPPVPPWFQVPISPRHPSPPPRAASAAHAEVLLSFTALWWRHLVLSVNHLI